MNIMLIGNGYDLHYKLPTKYINFLNVVNHMVQHPDDDMSTVGSIFKNEELQKTDSFIAHSYSCYKDTYNNISLDPNVVSQLVGLASNNIWFNYLLSAYNTDLGWIDFEKEISIVCSIFKEIFRPHIGAQGKSPFNYVIHNILNDPASQYIITHYFCFWGSIASEGVIEVDKEYRLEKPFGSGYYILNKEKIVNHLYNELQSLAEMLNIYLTSFVDNVCTELVKHNQITPLEFPVDQAVTLNYTHTFEKLHTFNARHVHGSTGAPIVLGINADQADELEAIDTTFICFKKYFQRVLFKTDNSYLEFVHKYISGPRPSNSYLQGKTHLFVIGHSLDITDAEIIKELFSFADEITILCHSIGAISSYVPNLVKIFGKSSFDQLRTAKNLQFKLLESELPDIVAEENKRIKAKQNKAELLKAIPLV